MISEGEAPPAQLGGQAGLHAGAERSVGDSRLRAWNKAPGRETHFRTQVGDAIWREDGLPCPSFVYLFVDSRLHSSISAFILLPEFERLDLSSRLDWRERSRLWGPELPVPCGSRRAILWA